MRTDPTWRNGLVSRDRATYEALRCVRTRRPLAPPFTYHGRRVLKATAHLPYGRSTHARAYLSHAVEGIYTAWLHGDLVAIVARWRMIMLRCIRGRRRSM